MLDVVVEDEIEKTMTSLNWCQGEALCSVLCYIKERAEEYKVHTTIFGKILKTI